MCSKKPALWHAAPVLVNFLTWGVHHWSWQEAQALPPLSRNHRKELWVSSVPINHLVLLPCISLSLSPSPLPPCSEILRVIDSLQLTAFKKVATPANWTVSCKSFCAVFSPSKIQGMAGGHGLGGPIATSKHLDTPSFTHQRKYVLKACRADMSYVCWGEHCLWQLFVVCFWHLLVSSPGSLSCYTQKNEGGW